MSAPATAAKSDFRHQTFCNAYGDTCITSECNRAVTPRVLMDARAWWGPKGEPPIAKADLSKNCPSQRKPEVK